MTRPRKQGNRGKLMSVQAGLSPAHHAIATQAPYQQGIFGQPAFGQLPYTQSNAGYQQGLTGVPIVAEVTLRVVSAALATIVEQMRTEPQALQTLCTQGQLAPQTYSNILVESARRTAPIVAAAIGAITQTAGMGFGSPFGGQQQGMVNSTTQSPWQQIGQAGQIGQIGQLGQLGQFGQLGQLGQSPMSGFGQPQLGAWQQPQISAWQQPQHGAWQQPQLGGIC